MRGRVRAMPPVTARAVQPNAGIRVWYEQQLHEMIITAHVGLIIALTDAWNVADIAHDAPSPSTAVQAALKAWGDKWRRKFDTAAAVLAKRFASRNFRATETSMRDTLKQAGFIVSFKPTRAAVDAYRAVIAENVGLIKSIPSQYLTSVQSQVWQSVTKGADMATLSRKLAESYRVTMKRAATIAEDQNAKAKAVIENTRRQELGITEAFWQHSHAGKEPRPSHVRMDGKRFNLKKGMYDPDENEWILPGQLIKCRCTSRAILPGLGE